MKKAVILIGLLFVIITGVLIKLIKSGAALRPAGVIKPMNFDPEMTIIAQSLAIRLFPEFQSHQNVYWVSEEDFEVKTQNILNLTMMELSSKVPNMSIQSWQVLSLQQFEQIQKAGPLPTEGLNSVPPLYIFIHSFVRTMEVPENCEDKKILDDLCLKAISVREVKKKFKDPSPYFFMRRYMDNNFYLFVESL